MRRRAFIAIFGSALLGGTAILWRGLSSFWRPGFDAHIAETVKALTDLMFPGDGLPGAAALGIHNRVVATPELRDAMPDGVGWFDRRAKSQGAANFLALDESGRSAAIDAAFASDDDAARQFVVLLRFYAGLDYYSHPTIKAAFSYTDPPQPEGFADFQDPPR
jgi:Gluconate 2-dehydrogenase subunit 3